ncbi:MAG TPA: ATP-binding protein [Silvibacterium sp.]|jgi:signal transduction histidine kinase|nr:ATP-binding protein [Silvibacterium sp.]
MRILRPRTIRGQLMSGLILFEAMVLAVLSVVLVREQGAELRSRTERRLEYQAGILAVQAGAAMSVGQLNTLQRVVDAMRDAPSIRAVQITDAQGRALLSSDPGMQGKLTLSPKERTYLRELTKPEIFSIDKKTTEAVAPVRIDGVTHGYAWIYPDDARDRAQLHRLLGFTLLSAFFGIIACTFFANLMARPITRPLSALMGATRQLIRNPEDTAAFPLAVTSTNETADLTMAFNLMVTAMQEQRAGLNDTLALLDSMLANAPIGFAFFDRRLRFVRVNQFLAQMNSLPVSRHLGRTVREIFVEPVGTMLEESIHEVFERGQAVQDLELSTGPENGPSQTRNWLANVYPVRTDAQTVRWVGVILVETTERRLAEDALRKSEKLAAAGRLAASIAHEINNPLEAVTNLLFLIRKGTLDTDSAGYAELAQHELARVSAITQQMLRFYRQPTLPALSNVCELLDSVLMLHQGRVVSLHIEVVRRYAEDVKLLCFAGEVRQLFANLIGNALDAMMSGGGRLLLRVRYTQAPGQPPKAGVRVTVADTGSGMSAEVRRHIFEPFFTTKEATGTGLGLWVSAEIVDKHHGTIRVRSRTSTENRKSGTVFTIFFPFELEDAVAQEKQIQVLDGVEIRG